ncbi:H-type small acid-soluble spore protein, partial [Heyndrickxia ginsengihumi]
MEAQRAQEIMNSPKMVTVTHNGTSVYIEHVDQQQGIRWTPSS